jgi:hypothetical protein
MNTSKKILFILIKGNKVLLALLLTIACQVTPKPGTKNKNNQEMNENLPTLAKYLADKGYTALFRDTGHSSQLDSTWNRFPKKDFEQLVADILQPPLARFLGCEILLKKDMTFFSRTELKALSDVYISALLNNYTGKMADWGFAKSNDDLGVLGGSFLIFSNNAVSPLIQLLDNDTLVHYERPLLGNDIFDSQLLQKIRIKDFAALYLSNIKNIPISFKAAFAERDEEITKLKKRIIKE